MALAQEQEQREISCEESLELCQCLLRVSIFHTAYLRGLFPDNNFKPVCLQQMDGMQIKMLRPTCDDSKRLFDWVQSGVFDALNRHYLKTLIFGIAADPEGNELLEEYIFSFNYANGGPSFDVTANVKGKAVHAKNATEQVQSVKYQVVRLMRMLVQVCQTLDKVPEERYMFMRLMYTDDTPDEYEPPYFRPADAAGAHFTRKPFSMHVGAVATNHHTVNLKVRSQLDSCDDMEQQAGLLEGQEAMDQAGYAGDAHEVMDEQMVVPSGGGSGGQHMVEGRDDDMTELDDEDFGSPSVNCGGRRPAAAPAAAKAPPVPQAPTVPPPVPALLMENVRTYCSGRAYVDITDIMGKFNLSSEAAEAAVHELEAQGVLQAQRGDSQCERYDVLAQRGAAAAADPAAAQVDADDVAAGMGALSVQPLDDAETAGEARRVTRSRMADSNRATMGGNQAVGAMGSEHTVSRRPRAAKRAMPDLAPPTAAPSAGGPAVFFDSQASEQPGAGRPKRARKSSMVDKCIGPTMAAPAAKTRKPAAGKENRPPPAVAAALNGKKKVAAPAASRTPRGRIGRMAV